MFNFIKTSDRNFFINIVKPYTDQLKFARSEYTHFTCTDYMKSKDLIVHIQ